VLLSNATDAPPGEKEQTGAVWVYIGLLLDKIQKHIFMPHNLV